MARYAIVGLGAYGSAAASALSRARQEVIGFDLHRPPHNQGSSHGRSRVIREAYWEHPVYVPLVRESMERWRQLEERSSRKLFTRTGALLLGPADGPLIKGSLRSMRRHRIEFEELDVHEVRNRFPQFDPGPDMVGLLEKQAGVLHPEDCIEAHLEEARSNGADLHFEEPVSSWSDEGDSVHLETAQGEYVVDGLLLCAGAWMPDLEPALPLEVERQVMHWFEPTAEPETPTPIFFFEESQGRHWYGLPDSGDGLKVANHHRGQTTTAETVDREVAQSEIKEIRESLEARLPYANGRHLRSCVCLYTNTPDGHFIIDRHPESPRALIASACSGHGFKFSSFLGGILAHLLISGRTPLDLGLFRAGRFGN
jgi:sarcosine oxidase